MFKRLCPDGCNESLPLHGVIQAVDASKRCVLFNLYFACSGVSTWKVHVSNASASAQDTTVTVCVSVSLLKLRQSTSGLEALSLLLLFFSFSFFFSFFDAWWRGLEKTDVETKRWGTGFREGEKCTSGEVYLPCIYTHAGESYRRRLRSLLYSCCVFRALINSLVC